MQQWQDSDVKCLNIDQHQVLSFLYMYDLRQLLPCLCRKLWYNTYVILYDFCLLAGGYWDEVIKIRLSDSLCKRRAVVRLEKLFSCLKKRIV
jgi:hypothetical protein